MKPDIETITSAKAGDLAAMELLLASTRQDLRRYAEHHCRMDDVEDAVQEALLITARRLRQLREAAALSSWMFRIVKRECNRLRRGWRMLTNQVIDETILPVVTPEANEWRVEVGRAMATLPPHYREILLMRDIEGMSLGEISRQLDLKLPATKSRLHRARSVMRAHLAGEAIEERF